MSSILQLADGRKLDIDRFFADQGKPPIMGMMGGQKTIFETGTAPKPSIYQRGAAFFTLDGKAITEEIARPWMEDSQIPESLKAQFRRFLDQAKTGKAPKESLGKIRRPKRQRKIERHLTPEDAGLSSKHAERV